MQPQASPVHLSETDEGDELFTTRYDVLESDSITGALTDVLETVMADEGESVLSDHLDPDAMDRPFTHSGRGSWTLTWSAGGYVIGVDNGGWIFVRRQ